MYADEEEIASQADDGLTQNVEDRGYSSLDLGTSDVNGYDGENGDDADADKGYEVSEADDVFVMPCMPGFGPIHIRRVFRHIRFQPCSRVIVSWHIDKIIARDLSLVASRLYRIAVTRPQTHVAVTLSPYLGADLPGYINHTREKERKVKETLYIPATYVLVQNYKSLYLLAQLTGNCSGGSGAQGNSTSIDWW